MKKPPEKTVSPVPVILTGTLLRAPLAHLTAGRTVECVLRVHARSLYMMSGRGVRRGGTYIVHVPASFALVLFGCALRGALVTVPGMLVPGTHGISARFVYRRRSAC
jgi:hypothetical protein